MRIRFKLMTKAAIVPHKMTYGSAGLDLYSSESIVVPPSMIVNKVYVEIGRATVKTGLMIQLPKNAFGKIGTRSGLSKLKNIEVGSGWIDSDYRGEILVEIKNFSSKPFNITQGDRIAQLFIIQKARYRIVQSNNLTQTKRGLHGFGSTGI